MQPHTYFSTDYTLEPGCEVLEWSDGQPGLRYPVRTTCDESNATVQAWAPVIGASALVIIFIGSSILKRRMKAREQKT